MDFLNNIVGQLGGVDKIASLAKQVGLSEEQVQSAMAALGKAAPSPGTPSHRLLSRPACRWTSSMTCSRRSAARMR